MRATWTRSVGPLLLCLLAAGCATTGEHEILVARVKALEDDRAKVKAKMAEDVARLAELNETLKRSEATLRKSGANLGLRVSQLEQAVPKASGRTDVVEYNHKRLADEVARIRKLLVNRFDAVALLLPQNLPSDADGMWRTGEGKLKAGETLAGRAIFEVFEASHPEDPRAIRARLKRAEIHAGSGETQRALKVYSKIEKLYPNAPELPAAVMRIGELFEKLGECKKAKSVYGYLAGKYKDAPEAEKARLRAEELKETCPK